MSSVELLSVFYYLLLFVQYAQPVEHKLHDVAVVSIRIGLYKT